MSSRSNGTSGLPSKARPKQPMAVPPGAISVWRVCYLVAKSKSMVHFVLNTYLDADEAYAEADRLYWARKYEKIIVEHKAVIELDGKFYLIYLRPITRIKPVSSRVSYGEGTSRFEEETPY